MRRLRDALFTLLLVPLLVGWEPLWRNQPDLADGIEAYAAKKWDEALAAFDQATKEVPDAPELHLARGAALYQKALLAAPPQRFEPMTAARDEFQRSLGLDGDARKAAAWHNLATSITQLAMLQVRNEKEGPKPIDREERIGLLQTAIDGFKKGLGLSPQDVDLKWNLEVAQRLLVQLEEEKKKEEEQKKKEQEKNKKDDQKKDQQNKDQQKQDQQNKDQQNKDQQNKDQQKQDQQNKDQQNKDRQKQDPQKKDQQKQDPQKQDQKQKDEQKKEQQKQEQQKKEQQKQQPAKPQPAKPEEAKPAPRLDLAPLEALKNSEKPLQLYRIMMDPKKSRMKVRKDW
jgi:Ca-activated chloride channel family protein